MFGLFSVFNFKKKEDYELVLAELDDKIKAAEFRLADLKLQQGYYSSSVFLYLVALYIIYVSLYFFLLRNPYRDDWYKSLLKAAPLLVVPIMLYLVRSTLLYFFTRRVSACEELLKALRIKQKIKVEELKKSSSYYQTKNLIERYSEKSEKRNRDFAPDKLKDFISPPAAHVGDRTPRTAQGNVKLNGKVQQARRGSNSAFVNNQGANSLSASLPLSAGNSRRRWYDKLVDAIVGEEEYNSVPQFALICHHCFSHNGLVSPIEYETIQYNCPSCKKFNPSKRSLRRKSLDTQDLPSSPKASSQPIIPRSASNAPKVRQQLPHEFCSAEESPLVSESNEQRDEEKQNLSDQKPAFDARSFMHHRQGYA